MDFLRRNKSIFIFGVIIGIAFIVIIIAGYSQARETQIALTPFIVNEQEEQEEGSFVSRGIFDLNQNTGTGDIAQVIEEEENTVEVIDSSEEEETTPNYPVKEIVFTPEGFSPANDNIKVGRTVRWINLTTEQISIRQLANKQPGDEYIVINPNEQKELTTQNIGLWTFREIGSNQTARIYVGE